MRKPFIAGNWKMNTTLESAIELAKKIATQIKPEILEKVDIAIAPPFPFLYPVSQVIKGTGIRLSAQNCYFEPKGAFTGEVSVGMLRDVGCELVIVGHSERRHIIGETDEMINKKVKAVLNEGLFPILCVGETLEEREKGKTMEVVREQVEKGLEGVSKEDIIKVTIAYEPVWAIGTGRTAKPYQAQEVQEFIRKLVSEKWGKEAGEKIRIQYGGSVKPENAKELLDQPDIDGALVGGASLKADSFVAIVKSAL